MGLVLNATGQQADTKGKREQRSKTLFNKGLKFYFGKQLFSK